MKKHFFLFFFLPFFYLDGSAQVGVNTETPKATVDIQAGSTASNTTEGLIVPRLTRSQLAGKDNLYGTAQVGSLIYVTTIDGALSSSGKTKGVSNSGYHYFDGSFWNRLGSQWFDQSTNLPATTNNSTSYIYYMGYTAIGTNVMPAGVRLNVNGKIQSAGLQVNGDASVTGKTTIANLQYTKAPLNNAVLTSDASGNASWSILNSLKTSRIGEFYGASSGYTTATEFSPKTPYASDNFFNFNAPMYRRVTLSQGRWLVFIGVHMIAKSQYIGKPGEGGAFIRLTLADDSGNNLSSGLSTILGSVASQSTYVSRYFTYDGLFGDATITGTLIVDVKPASGANANLVFGSAGVYGTYATLIGNGGILGAYTTNQNSPENYFFAIPLNMEN